MKSVKKCKRYSAFYPETCVHLHLFTVQSSPPQDGCELARRSNVLKQSMGRLCIYVYGGDGNVYSEIDRSTTNHAANIR